MRICLVKDLDQYDKANEAIMVACARAGHSVEMRTHANVVESNADAVVFIQALDSSLDVSLPKFWVPHGISCTKPWCVPPTWDTNSPSAPLFSFAPYWEEELATRHPRATLIKLDGWPVMDYWAAQRPRMVEIRTRLRHAKLYEPGKPLVVYAPSYRHTEGDQFAQGRRAFEDVREVERRMSGPWTFVMLQHQMDGRSDGVVQGWAGSTAKYAKHDTTKLDLFAAADLVISDTSSMAYESLAFDRPVVLLNNPDEPGYLHLSKLRDGKPLTLGTWATLDTLRDVVIDELAHPDRMREQREWWRKYVVGTVDGRASDRMLLEVEKVVKERRK